MPKTRSWTIGLTIWYTNKFTYTLKVNSLHIVDAMAKRLAMWKKERKSFNCLLLNPFYHWNCVRLNIKSVPQKDRNISYNKQTNKRSCRTQKRRCKQQLASESNLRDLNELQSNCKPPHLNIQVKLWPPNLLASIVRSASQLNRLQLNHDNTSTGRL